MHYLDTLGEVGYEAARALAIEKWLTAAWEYPAAPRKEGLGPLGWYDPVGGTWERPGLGVEYNYSNSPNLDITVEEARGCYLWMVMILSILKEAWNRMSEPGELADLPWLDWSSCKDASPLERARIALSACDAVVAALRERSEPVLNRAEEWFEELKDVIATAAIVPSELRAVQTRYDVGLLLTGQFREAIRPDALAKSGLSDEVDDLLRDMEWALIEVRPWISLVPEPGSPAATVGLSRHWEIPCTPWWLAWQAVYCGDDLPLDPSWL
ncbi:MAG: hypothetical protein RMK01_06525 [Thermomicrobium sp.]|nr:hypothetical protein [Thermomicrobium sp.]